MPAIIANTPHSYNRLFNTPLDSSETFNSIESFKAYMASNAFYEGQRIVVNDMTYGQIPFIICNNIAILDIPGFEHTFITDGSDKYLLVSEKHANASYNNLSISDKSLNLLPLTNIFNNHYSGSKNYSFRYDGNKSTSTVKWSQSAAPQNTPTTSSSTNFIGVNSSGDTYYSKINSGSCTTLNTSAEYHKIYILATNYYNAMPKHMRCE